MKNSILDYQQDPEYSKLKNCIQEDRADPVVELLVDYLNFFEFIASLVDLKQLKLEEVEKIFKYYLENLGKIDFVVVFIKGQNFESLYSLLKQMNLIHSTME